jgi:5,10-methylenetetrahydromethanopterin reductase
MADLPRISIRLHGGLTLAQCVARAVAAEAAGLHGVWFAENPFSRSVLPAATACALATERVSIGLGVLNPFNRHPTLMAMEVAALDEAAAGRVILGVGAAAPPMVRQMGLRWERPLTAVRETVEIVGRLLAGEEVTYAGRVFSVEGVRLEMPLVRARVPIYVGGISERALRLCGEVADGLNISNMCPPGFAARAMQVVRGAAAAAGRPSPSPVVQYVPCAVSSDVAAARRAATTTVGALLALYWMLYAELPAVQAGLVERSGIDERSFRAAVRRLQAGELATEVLDDRFVELYAIAGTPDDVPARARTYAEGGVTELALTVLGDDPVGTIAAIGQALRGRGEPDGR